MIQENLDPVIRAIGDTRPQPKRYGDGEAVIDAVVVLTAKGVFRYRVLRVLGGDGEIQHHQ
jgi:hypothetical protein